MILWRLPYPLGGGQLVSGGAHADAGCCTVSPLQLAGRAGRLATGHEAVSDELIVGSTVVGGATHSPDRSIVTGPAPSLVREAHREPGPTTQRHGPRGSAMWPFRSFRNINPHW